MPHEIVEYHLASSLQTVVVVNDFVIIQSYLGSFGCFSFKDLTHENSIKPGAMGLDLYLSDR